MKRQLLSEAICTRRELLGAGLTALAGMGLGHRQATADEEKRPGRPNACIDAHVHVWTPDTARYPLGQGFTKDKMATPSFTPEELFAHSRPCGVGRIVLIQMSYYRSDNSYMLDMIRKYPGVFSGVACVDKLDNPAQKMRELARQGVRGFRFLARKQDPDCWLAGEKADAVWRCGAEEGLAICPLMDALHLSALDAMCARHPKTPVVVDHFARIGADGEIRNEDLDRLCDLARHRNVRVKLSAFYALGKKKAPYLDLVPMIQRLLTAFGPERLMWASDSPFQVLGGHRYQDSIALIRDHLDGLSTTDRDWLLRRTAEATFFA